MPQLRDLRCQGAPGLTL